MGYYEFPHTRTYDQDLGELIELYNKMLGKYNELVNIYEIFTKNLKEHTVEEIRKMAEDGTLARLINEEIFGELNRKVNLNATDIAKLKTDLASLESQVDYYHRYMLCDSATFGYPLFIPTLPTSYTKSTGYTFACAVAVDGYLYYLVGIYDQTHYLYRTTFTGGTIGTDNATLITSLVLEHPNSATFNEDTNEMLIAQVSNVVIGINVTTGAVRRYTLPNNESMGSISTGYGGYIYARDGAKFRKYKIENGAFVKKFEVTKSATWTTQVTQGMCVYGQFIVFPLSSYASFYVTDLDFNLIKNVSASGWTASEFEDCFVYGSRLFTTVNVGRTEFNNIQHNKYGARGTHGFIVATDLFAKESIGAKNDSNAMAFPIYSRGNPYVTLYNGNPWKVDVGDTGQEHPNRLYLRCGLFGYNINNVNTFGYTAKPLGMFFDYLLISVVVNDPIGDELLSYTATVNANDLINGHDYITRSEFTRSAKNGTLRTFGVSMQFTDSDNPWIEFKDYAWTSHSVTGEITGGGTDSTHTMHIVKIIGVRKQSFAG